MSFLDKILGVKKEKAKESEKSFQAGKPASESKSAYIITFNLLGKKPLEKVKFCQALFGRKEGSGILQSIGGKKLGNGCVLVHAGEIEKIEAFMSEKNVAIQRQKIILAE